MTVRISLICEELTIPGGQVTILDVQVGGGETQLNSDPAGVEFRVMAVFSPEQMVFVRGGLTTGTGLIVTARPEVGPL